MRTTQKNKKKTYTTSQPEEVRIRMQHEMEKTALCSNNPTRIETVRLFIRSPIYLWEYEYIFILDGALALHNRILSRMKMEIWKRRKRNTLATQPVENFMRQNGGVADEGDRSIHLNCGI